MLPAGSRKADNLAEDSRPAGSRMAGDLAEDNRVVGIPAEAADTAEGVVARTAASADTVQSFAQQADRSVVVVVVHLQS